MKFFEEIALRLKQQLKVTEDKQLAEALGMTGKAWTARKRRESFPEEKLWALAAQRPDIDVGYVLTGIKKGEEHSTTAAQLMRVKVLASCLADELHHAKTSLPYEFFYALLDELVRRFGKADSFQDVEEVRLHIRAQLNVK